MEKFWGRCDEMRIKKLCVAFILLSGCAQAMAQQYLETAAQLALQKVHAGAPVGYACTLALKEMQIQLSPSGTEEQLCFAVLQSRLSAERLAPKPSDLARQQNEAQQAAARRQQEPRQSAAQRAADEEIQREAARQAQEQQRIERQQIQQSDNDDSSRKSVQTTASVNQTATPTRQPYNNDSSTSPATWAFFVVLAAGIIFFIWYKIDQHNRLRKKSFAVIDEFARELKVRRSQLTIRQSYGLIDDSRWIKEQTVFIQRVLLPRTGSLKESILNEVSARIAAVTAGFDAVSMSTPTWGDPIAYERHVAECLRRYGWDAKATQASGDQGIDVHATKNGFTLVVQCKLYSNPVGNDAVQQIIAGRSFARADFAAVVSNAEFTRAARQLASSADVFLFHHDQIVDLDAACMGTRPAPPKQEQANVSTRRRDPPLIR